SERVQASGRGADADDREALRSGGTAVRLPVSGGFLEDHLRSREIFTGQLYDPELLAEKRLFNIIASKCSERPKENRRRGSGPLQRDSPPQDNLNSFRTAGGNSAGIPAVIKKSL